MATWFSLPIMRPSPLLPRCLLQADDVDHGHRLLAEQAVHRPPHRLTGRLLHRRVVLAVAPAEAVQGVADRRLELGEIFIILPRLVQAAGGTLRLAVVRAPPPPPRNA